VIDFLTLFAVTLSIHVNHDAITTATCHFFYKLFSWIYCCYDSIEISRISICCWFNSAVIRRWLNVLRRCL